MRVLVAYFSRTGTTRRAAEAVREALEKRGIEVVLEEVVDRRRWGGFCGFVRGGMWSLWRRKSAYQPIVSRPGEFDLLVVGTPVWAWNVPPVIRAFCEVEGPGAERVAFLCTMGGTGARRTFRTMAALCDKEPLATLALVEKAVKDRTEEFQRQVEGFADRIVRSTGG